MVGKHPQKSGVGDSRGRADEAQLGGRLFVLEAAQEVRVEDHVVRAEAALQHQGVIVGQELAAGSHGDADGTTGSRGNERAHDVFQQGHAGPGRPDAVFDDMPAFRARHGHRSPRSRDEDRVAFDDRIEDAGQPGGVRAVEFAAAGVKKIIAPGGHDFLNRGPAGPVFGPADYPARVDLGGVAVDDRFDERGHHFFFGLAMAPLTPSSKGSVRMGVIQPSGLSAYVSASSCRPSGWVSMA